MNVELPRIEQLSSNLNRVFVGKLTIWFSYETPVAFKDNCRAIMVRENDWSVTTGKHLNAIDGGNKKTRVPGPIWEDMLKQAMGQ